MRVPWARCSCVPVRHHAPRAPASPSRSRIRTERPNRALELDDEQTARAYDTQEAAAIASLEHAQPGTPPRSGSGASCGRPGSRELQLLWEEGHAEATVSPLNGPRARALAAGGVDEMVLVESTVRRMASSEIS